MIRFFSIFLMLTAPLFAVAKQAEPMSTDPLLEERVMAISHELRCLVCQNQTIADSDAELAVDLRQQVREMISEGKDEGYIVDYMVERYGDFVRYRPPFKATTFLLWVGPFLLLIIGLFVLWINLRRRSVQKSDVNLTQEENANLKKLLGDKPS